MTGLSKELRTLPLLGSTQDVLFWLFMLAFGIPVVAIVGTLGYQYSRNAPAAPLAISGALAIVIMAGVTLWIAHMIRSAAVTLDSETLTVAAGLSTQRFPLASLRSHGLRSIDLAAHRDLRPWLRTYGIGMPGFGSGWFRLKNGGKAFCLVTDRKRVTVLKTDGGTWILLSLADPSVLQSALASR